MGKFGLIYLIDKRKFCYPIGIKLKRRYSANDDYATINYSAGRKRKQKKT
jgi:hypothetical protein